MLYLWLQGQKITILQHDVATVYHSPLMHSIYFYAYKISGVFEDSATLRGPTAESKMD